ncbi:hypothetical protein [Fulvimarina endophytica]|nr:hypothetical protein [Fulvimarina endophytica]
MTPVSILIAIGAGLTSALLFAGMATQSAFAVGFALATPVPVAIAGLGWGSAVGFLSAIIAPAIVFTVIGSVPSALTIAGSMTLPMAILAHLATRRMHAVSEVDTGHSPHSLQTAAGDVTWMPIGRILFVLAALAAIACVAIGTLMGYDPAQIEPALREAFFDPNVTLDPAQQVQLENLVSVVVGLVPLIQPTILTLTLVVCLHFAASIVRRSGRLARPKDDLPESTSLPQDALFLFAFALAGTFLSGAAGIIATVFVGAFGTAFALVGLARFHRRTRERPGRGFALFLVYAAVLFLTFPIFIFVVVGIVHVWKHGERIRPARGR